MQFHFSSRQWKTIQQPIELVKTFIEASSKSSVVEDRSLQLHQVLRDRFPQQWSRIEPLLSAADQELALTPVIASPHSAILTIAALPAPAAPSSSDEVAALKETVKQQAVLIATLQQWMARGASLRFEKSPHLFKFYSDRGHEMATGKKNIYNFASFKIIVA